LARALKTDILFSSFFAPSVFYIIVIFCMFFGTFERARLHKNRSLGEFLQADLGSDELVEIVAFSAVRRIVESTVLAGPYVFFFDFRSHWRASTASSVLIKASVIFLSSLASRWNSIHVVQRQGLLRVYPRFSTW